MYGHVNETSPGTLELLLPLSRNQPSVRIIALNVLYK